MSGFKLQRLGLVMERDPGNDGRHLCHSAGVMVLSKDHPRVIRYRSAEPVLTPSLPQERDGTISNVVFPTGIDRCDDRGLPDRLDVYYGMADDRIGWQALTCRSCCRREESPIRRRQRYEAPEL